MHSDAAAPARSLVSLYYRLPCPRSDLTARPALAPNRRRRLRIVRLLVSLINAPSIGQRREGTREIRYVASRGRQSPTVGRQVAEIGRSRLGGPTRETRPGRLSPWCADRAVTRLPRPPSGHIRSSTLAPCRRLPPDSPPPSRPALPWRSFRPVATRHLETTPVPCTAMTSPSSRVSRQHTTRRTSASRTT